MKYTNEIIKINNYAKQHQATKHDLLVKISNQDANEFEVAHIIKGYVGYSTMFPCILQVVKSWWINDNVTYSLLDSVYSDETSVDKNGFSHSDQLTNCANSFLVDYDDEVLCQCRRAAVNYARKLIKHASSDPHVSLGIIGPGIENIVPTIYRNFLTWFESADKANYEYYYFIEHSYLDIKHANIITGAIENACDSVDDVSKVKKGAEIALRERVVLWNDFIEIINKI